VRRFRVFVAPSCQGESLHFARASPRLSRVPRKGRNTLSFPREFCTGVNAQVNTEGHFGTLWQQKSGNRALWASSGHDGTLDHPSAYSDRVLWTAAEAQRLFVRFLGRKSLAGQRFNFGTKTGPPIRIFVNHERAMA
jgi:hypothetical protein